MKFDDYSLQVQKILRQEFNGRDRDIQTSVTLVKQKTNARGILHSTTTVQALADFFLAEFRARANLIAEHAISALRSDGASTLGNNEIPAGLALFRVLATRQVEVILAAYDDAVKIIITSLQSNMPDQIRSEIVERINELTQKLDLSVELEYKLSENPSKEVLTLRPSIYGIGIDLKELWKRFF